MMAGMPYDPLAETMHNHCRLTFRIFRWLMLGAPLLAILGLAALAWSLRGPPREAVNYDQDEQQARLMQQTARTVHATRQAQERGIGVALLLGGLAWCGLMSVGACIAAIGYRSTNRP
jgi:hypothetical protein